MNEKLNEIYQRLEKAQFCLTGGKSLVNCNQFAGKPCLKDLEIEVAIDLAYQPIPKVAAVVLTENIKGDQQFYGELYILNGEDQTPGAQKKSESVNALVKENINAFFEGMHIRETVTGGRPHLNMPKLSGLEEKLPQLPAVMLLRKHKTQDRYAVEIYG